MILGRLAVEQSHRLPSGGAIDRLRPIRFSFDGTAYGGYAGDTLASALLANGGFAEEALQPLAEGEAMTLRATAALDGDDEAEAAAAEAGAANGRSAESLSDGLAAAARTIRAARARLASGEERAAA